jgi:hypothetical protein
MHDGRRRALLVLLLVGAVIAVPVLAQHLSGTVPVDDGVPLSSSSNLTIVLDGQTDAYLTDFTPASNRVDLITEAGNATFEGQDARLVIDKDQIDNEWMNVTGVEASSGYVVLDVGTTNATRIGGGVDSFNQRRQGQIDTSEIDDGVADYIYSASSGTSELYFVGDSGLPNTVALADSSGTYLAFVSDSSPVNGNLNYQATGLPSGSNTLYVQSNGGAPSVSNVKPTGDQDTEPTQITADVSDPDIGNGDDVTVTFNLDSSQIDQQTISSNQTVSTSMPNSGQTGGSHDITVDVEDSFGATDSATSSYRVPDVLYIRNETNHSELIDSPVDSTVRFFGTDQVFTRQTSDGTVNMTNLPVNQDFIVEVQPSGNFTDRTVQIQSIYEQQSVYLLNTTAYTTIESRFQLNDPTGQFDSTTVIFIQKPVNISGNVSYQTIHADEFGVEGVTATLQAEQRYRVKVKSAEGVSQIIGPYRSDVAETVEVRPENPTG